MSANDSYRSSGIVRSLLCIATTFHLSPVARLKTALKKLALVLPVETVTIFVLDEGKQHLVWKISQSLSKCSLKSGEGIAGKCAALAVPLVEGSDSACLEEAGDIPVRMYYAFPLPGKKGLSGVITVGTVAEMTYFNDNPHVAEDIILVIAGLLEQFTCEEKSARLLQSLHGLGKLGRVLTRSMPPNTLLPVVLNACHRYTGACCTIMRIFESGNLPAGVYRKIKPQIAANEVRLLAMEQEHALFVQERGVLRVVTDLPVEDGFPPSLICVPLLVEGNCLGTITFLGKTVNGGLYCNFDENDIVFIESVALHTASALEGASTYRQMSLLSEENDKKIKELSLLYRLSNTMLTTINLNKLVHLILTAITSGNNLFFERAMLFLLNERSGVLQGMLGVTVETADVPHVHGDSDAQITFSNISEKDIERQQNSEFSQRVRQTRLPLDRGHNIASRVVKEKRLISIEDVAKETNIEREIVDNFGIRAFAIAPLMAKDQVVGVVYVDNPFSGKQITPDDLRFLQLLTNQAGIAIENSVLYKKIEDTNRNLQEVQERLIQGERLAAIGEMSAGIAHELKNPLVSIGGFARRLEKKMPIGSAEGKYAAMIVREVGRLEDMLTDILAFTRKSTMSLTHCTIEEIVEDALDIVAPFIEESNITIEKRYPSGPISFPGDCPQLKQVFINLFANAQQAMKSGGTLEISIDPYELDGEHAVCVMISDTGGGIALDILHNIFNPFFTTKETGTGLGLPIAHRIVTNHGGEIQVTNRPGCGAVFKVIIPLNR